MLHVFGQITESKIEHAVEREFDRIDQWLISGQITQEQYDDLSDQIGNQADALYRQHVTPFHHFPGVQR